MSTRLLAKSNAKASQSVIHHQEIKFLEKILDFIFYFFIKKSVENDDKSCFSTQKPH